MAFPWHPTFRILTFLLSCISWFLTIWIVVPAPTLTLLPLGVGAPEISPWLMVTNAIALWLVWYSFRLQGWLWLLLGIGLASLVISSLPLSQFTATQHRAEQNMQAALGKDYLSQIAPDRQAALRPHPLILADSWRGIAPTNPVQVESGISFAQPAGVPLTLTVYRPMRKGLHPTLVMIYGGAWQRGSPNNDAPFSRYLAGQGYTVVAIAYRHAPQHPFPAQIEDVRMALTYIQQQANFLGVDWARLAIMGRSAGAHLAMLAAYQTNDFPIRAVINYYGPVDLTRGYNDPPQPDPINSRAILRAFLGGTPTNVPDLYRQASPYTYVNRPLPPSLLVYGGRDHVVEARFGRSLYAKLQATGTPAVWLEIPWAEHAFDQVFRGVSNQLALYYTERFLAWALR